MLERNLEAKAYFELSNAILECELGAQHERTLTTARNLKKIGRTNYLLENNPEFRPLWTCFVPHPCPKAKKKGKKKKGKKK